MPNIQPLQTVTSSEKVEEWFQKIIEFIKVDQLLMTTDVAAPDTKEFYNTLIFGNAKDAVVGSPYFSARVN